MGHESGFDASESGHRVGSRLAGRGVSRRGSTADRLAIVLLLIGVAFRLWLCCSLPVGYDEVFVMAVGLEEMRESVGAFVIDVPVTRSSAITPLWWWLQSIPFALAGELSLAALRFVPAALGTLTLLAAYLWPRRAFGRRIALGFLGFICLSDILAFSNGRAEFSESLSVLCLIAVICTIGRPERVKTRAMAWATLLLANLGKGILVIALAILADVVAAACMRRGGRPYLACVGLSLVAALLPAIAYLGLADSRLSGAEVIRHEATEATGVLDLARKLVLDYSQIKAHVTGTGRHAAIVWLDFGVWPVTCMSAPLLLAAVSWSAMAAFRRRSSCRPRRRAVGLGLTAWAIVGAATVIVRGTLGARFHLMYLPAAWMVGAMFLSRRSAKRVAWWHVAAGVGWSGYVAVCASWLDWHQSVLSAKRWLIVAGALSVIVVGALMTARWLGRPAKAALIAVVVAAWLTGAVVSGPLAWGPHARFEPMFRSEELAALDAYRSGGVKPKPHGRSLYIDLANFHLTRSGADRSDFERSLHFARLEARRVPKDPRAWAYVGEALLRLGAGADEVRSAWSRSLELAPNERLAERLKALTSEDR